MILVKGLRAGDHAFVVGNDGHASIQGRVRLKEGETREVVVRLEKLPEKE